VSFKVFSVLGEEWQDFSSSCQIENGKPKFNHYLYHDTAVIANELDTASLIYWV
jgi:hypothetical protein